MAARWAAFVSRLYSAEIFGAASQDRDPPGAYLGCGGFLPRWWAHAGLV